VLSTVYRSLVDLIMFSGSEYRCIRHPHTAPGYRA
jgi:hypothetical protein